MHTYDVMIMLMMVTMMTVDDDDDEDGDGRFAIEKIRLGLFAQKQQMIYIQTRNSHNILHIHCMESPELMRVYTFSLATWAIPFGCNDGCVLFRSHRSAGDSFGSIVWRVVEFIATWQLGFKLLSVFDMDIRTCAVEAAGARCACAGCCENIRRIESYGGYMVGDVMREWYQLRVLKLKMIFDQQHSENSSSITLRHPEL